MRSTQKMLDDVNESIAEFNAAHNPSARIKMIEGLVSLALAVVFVGMLSLITYLLV